MSNEKNDTRYIVTSDWHLREDKPRCRLDNDWMETQKKIIRFVYKEAEERYANLIIAGDLFHRPRVSEEVLNMFLDIALHTEVKTYLIAGQHDLLYHNWDNVEKSSFGVMWSIVKSDNTNLKDARQIANACHYGKEFKYSYSKLNLNMVILHRLVYKNNVPDYIDHGNTAEEILLAYPNVIKYIITGDNHNGFIYENDYRYVINPGCLTIQVSDKINYKPFIIYIDMHDEKIVKINVPYNSEIITDEYIKQNEERDERIEAFLSTIKKGEKISLSFEDNLRNYIKKNKKVLGGRLINMLEEIIEEARNV